MIAEVDVGYGQLRFSEIVTDDGSRAISLSEQAPGNATSTPVDELFARYGALTALETFRAVLPEAEPPAVLVEAHPGETLELGRSSDSVIEAVFDRATLRVDKSEAACSNFVYLDPGSSGDWTDRRMTFFDNASTASKCLSFCGFMTRKRVTLGTCNESPQSLFTEACWSTDPNDLFGTCFAEVELAGGWMQRWWHYNIVNGSGDALPAMHSVDAWGPSFAPRDVRLATAFLGPQACTSSSQCPSGQICRSGTCQFNIQ